MLGGVSIVTALPLDSAVGPVQIEHPSGKLVVAIVFEDSRVHRSTVIRSARELFDRTIFPLP